MREYSLLRQAPPSGIDSRLRRPTPMSAAIGVVILAVESGLSATDTIILEGGRQTRDGGTIGYEYPEPKVAAGVESDGRAVEHGRRLRREPAGQDAHPVAPGPVAQIREQPPEIHDTPRARN